MAISNLCSPLKVTYVSDNMYSRSSYTLWLKFGVLGAFISICIVDFFVNVLQVLQSWSYLCVAEVITLYLFKNASFTFMDIGE